MHLTHLGLPVRDAGRSQRFYAAYFGFDPATAQRYPDGTVIIRNGDGFDLALHAGPDAGSPQPFLHFGFRLASGAQVRAVLGRLRGGWPPGRGVLGGMTPGTRCAGAPGPGAGLAGDVLGGEVLAVEGEDPLPAVLGRLDPVRGPVDGEE